MSLKAELALIRSLIMPIDSMISFVDLRVLPIDPELLSLSICSYVFSRALGLLLITVCGFSCDSGLVLHSNPAGSSAST